MAFFLGVLCTKMAPRRLAAVLAPVIGPTEIYPPGDLTETPLTRVVGVNA